MSLNPSGKCQCGCGTTTPQSYHNQGGYLAGDHHRFLAGHWHILKRKTNPNHGKQSQRLKLLNAHRIELAQVRLNGKSVGHIMRANDGLFKRKSDLIRFLNFSVKNHALNVLGEQYRAKSNSIQIITPRLSYRAWKVEMDLKAQDRKDIREDNPLLRHPQRFLSIDVFDPDLESRGLKQGPGFAPIHLFIDSNALSPDEELMRKEEAEDESERKYELYRRGRRVEFITTNWEEKRLAALTATAPLFKGNRGKLRTVIGRHSPERGVTQRHIKMSPTQFV